MMLNRNLLVVLFQTSKDILPCHILANLRFVHRLEQYLADDNECLKCLCVELQVMIKPARVFLIDSIHALVRS